MLGILLSNRRRVLIATVLTFIMWRLYRARNATLELRRAKNPNPLSSKVLQYFLHAESYKQGYVDSFITRWGGSFQGTISTVIHYFARTIVPINVTYERELVILKDGGTIALDWAFGKPPANAEPRPTVFIHHGLCGDSDSLYVKHLIPKLKENGYRAVVMVARGCGGLTLSTPEGFTASRTNDMREAIKIVRDQLFVSDMYGVGFSLGAVLLLKYVGEEGPNTPLRGAVAISPSFDFSVTPPHFDMWSRGRLVKGLINWAKRHEDVLSTHPKVKWQELITAQNVRQFDHAGVVGPHGYRDVDHYYEDSSPRYKTSGITIPTLSVSARDDPVCCATTVPAHEHEDIGPGLVACLTDAGGHVSFAEGIIPSESWADRVIVDWLNSCKHAARQ
jgi:predicted alpha/beta-fold hydrolase